MPLGAAATSCSSKPWPSMLRGIYGDPERYKATYWSSFPGMYFPGDGGKRDEDGYYWLLGRVDDVMNVSGHRLSTTEIESALVDHPTCRRGRGRRPPDEITGEAIFAFVILQGGHRRRRRTRRGVAPARRARRSARSRGRSRSCSRRTCPRRAPARSCAGSCATSPAGASSAIRRRWPMPGSWRRSARRPGRPQRSRRGGVEGAALRGRSGERTRFSLDSSTHDSSCRLAISVRGTRETTPRSGARGRRGGLDARSRRGNAIRRGSAPSACVRHANGG